MDRHERPHPVLGRDARICSLALCVIFLVWSVVFGMLCFQTADKLSLFVTLLAAGDVIWLALLYILPKFVYYSDYTYTLQPDGITLWHREEAVMTMAWQDTDVSLGSYIRRGSEDNPSVCYKAICFTRHGEMRKPPRFPKRALKGAAGELCIAYSRARLKEVFQACDGNISGDVDPDGLRLALSDTDLMVDALERLQRSADRHAGRKARSAERQQRLQSGEYGIRGGLKAIGAALQSLQEMDPEQGELDEDSEEREDSEALDRDSRDREDNKLDGESAALPSLLKPDPERAAPTGRVSLRKKPEKQSEPDRALDSEPASDLDDTPVEDPYALLGDDVEFL